MRQQKAPTRHAVQDGARVGAKNAARREPPILPYKVIYLMYEVKYLTYVGWEGESRCERRTNNIGNSAARNIAGRAKNGAQR